MKSCYARFMMFIHVIIVANSYVLAIIYFLLINNYLIEKGHIKVTLLP